MIKKDCFNAWTKCSAHVTAVMVELMDRPFQQLKMDAKFAALEELFTKIYGGGAPSINEMRKLIFCQRNQNVEMLPPSQNALFQHCRQAMFQASIWATAHDATVIEPDPCLHGWRQSDSRPSSLIPEWVTIAPVALVCAELVKCGCCKPCAVACSCKKHSLACTSLCKCKCRRV